MKIKTKGLDREYKVDLSTLDAEARTVELVFSTEAPYQRSFGYEVLSHEEGAVNMTRLDDGAALLWNHNPDVQIGVVNSAVIGEDRKGRALVKFSRNQKGAEIFQDVQDGIVSKLSVGYVIEAMKKTGEQDGIPVYVATRWFPHEISAVSIPADIGATIGRSADFFTREYEIDVAEESVEEPKEEVIEQKALEPEAVETAVEEAKSEEVKPSEEEATGERALQDSEPRYFGENSTSTTDAVDFAKSDNTREKDMSNMQDIGMSAKEVKQYSLVRAINAAASGNWKDAGLEAEASVAMSQKIGRDAQGFFVPFEVQTRASDMTAGTAADGGNTIATELRASSLIEMLRKRLAIVQVGARMLTGLVGNVAIPRQTGGAAAHWVAEDGAATSSNPTFDQVLLSPKTVAAETVMSRKLLMQSSLDIEMFVQEDLAKTLAQAIDLAAILGTGLSNQPKGILNYAGIGSVVGGVNGAAPTWQHMVALETAVESADSQGSAYLINAKTRGKLKTTEKATGTAQFVYDGASINGYNVAVSNQMPSDLTKGTGTNLSAALFGNFQDLLIGNWGVLDILVDPFSSSSNGAVKVVALNDVDVALRHAASFAAMVDVITA